MRKELKPLNVASVEEEEEEEMHYFVQQTLQVNVLKTVLYKGDGKCNILVTSTTGNQ